MIMAKMHQGGNGTLRWSHQHVLNYFIQFKLHAKGSSLPKRQSSSHHSYLESNRGVMSGVGPIMEESKKLLAGVTRGFLVDLKIKQTFC